MKPDWKHLLRHHADDLPDLDELPPEHHQQLHDWVSDTIRREAHALESALESALEFVPRLLRGAVKKLVSG